MSVAVCVVTTSPHTRVAREPHSCTGSGAVAAPSLLSHSCANLRQPQLFLGRQHSKAVLLGFAASESRAQHNGRESRELLTPELS